MLLVAPILNVAVEANLFHWFPVELVEQTWQGQSFSAHIGGGSGHRRENLSLVGRLRSVAGLASGGARLLLT